MQGIIYELFPCPFKSGEAGSRKDVLELLSCDRCLGRGDAAGF